MTVRAPAKLNLCLFLGEPGIRDDGLHELRSVFCPLSLADRLVVSEAERDEVVCEGVEGPNLAAAALTALRAAGWDAPPQRIEIEKRIPVAAGLGGGSADAAAVLRLARGELDGLEEIAARLGADVPSQLDPALSLVGGAGERVEPIGEAGEFAAVLIPDEHGLPTAEVYAEADRLELGRPRPELDELEGRIRAAAVAGAGPLGYANLLINDLGPAALSLRPELSGRLEQLRSVGADVVLVAGSGPTVVGLFATLPAADAAASALPHRYAGAIVTGPERFVTA